MALRLLDPMARPERPGSNYLSNLACGRDTFKAKTRRFAASDRRIDQAKPGRLISEPGPFFLSPVFSTP